MPGFMPGQTLAPLPGGDTRVTPSRIIPPLPAGIPILPGQLKAPRAARRLSGCLILLIVLGGLVALVALLWLSTWYSDYDSKRIDPVVTQAMVAHVPKGTRLAVTIWGGPRILEIGNARVEYHGQLPTTCVYVKVFDPKTGAEDRKTRYVGATCIDGLRYPIR
jgi:hypothetical protein